jgi:hypothetical protein
MAESKGLLARWSRLKREPRSVEDAPATVESEGKAEPVDLESLPPLESLCADSDYSVFLRRGVPEALRRAALRRAWATDPTISAFRGFAEYDWDCNAPGYGALLPTDDILKLCDSILRPVPDTEPPDEPPKAEQRIEAEDEDRELAELPSGGPEAT